MPLMGRVWVGVSLAILTRQNRLRPSRTPVPPVLSGRDQASPTPSKTKGPARGAPISQRYDAIMATLLLLTHGTGGLGEAPGEGVVDAGLHQGCGGHKRRSGWRRAGLNATKIPLEPYQGCQFHANFVQNFCGNCSSGVADRVRRRSRTPLPGKNRPARRPTRGVDRSARDRREDQNRPR